MPDEVALSEYRVEAGLYSAAICFDLVLRAFGDARACWVGQVDGLTHVDLCGLVWGHGVRVGLCVFDERPLSVDMRVDGGSFALFV